MVLYIQQETRVINSISNLSSPQKLEVLIMFELTPFGYRRVASYNPFRELEEMSHSFWNDEDKGDNGFVRRERYYGSFSRSFNIKGIDTDGITAEYNDGVLTLTMPEKTPEVPAARRLEIK